MSAIELRGAAKRFGDTAGARGLDLTVAAGIDHRRAGRVGQRQDDAAAGDRRVRARSTAAPSRIGGQVVDDGRRTVAAQHRGVGYVAQEGALFPHLTVPATSASGCRDASARRRPPARADGLPDLGGATRTSSRAASSSGSRWPGRWRSARGWCCSTSRSARSTPRCAPTCAATWRRILGETGTDRGARHPRPGRGAGARRQGRAAGRRPGARRGRAPRALPRPPRRRHRRGDRRRPTS